MVRYKVLGLKTSGGFYLMLNYCYTLIPVVPGLVGINCDSAEALNPGFGESFETAKQAAEALDRGFEVNMQYKV